MPTFLDESGDTGPVPLGGKAYFRLAAVWVPSYDVADDFRRGIRRLRSILGLRANYEFKFAKTHHRPEWRENFFDVALGHEFRFAVSSIDKRDGYGATASGSEMHWACATELAAKLRPVYRREFREHSGPLREPIVVDDNKDHAFLEIVKRQFRALGVSEDPRTAFVGKVSFRNSVPDEMLQLVDMICGAAGAWMDQSGGHWYESIAERDLG